MENVIVTGANGFIGKHLVNQLRNAGHTVAIINHESFEEPTKLQKELHKFNPKYFIHLAAYGNMAYHTDDFMIAEANVFNLQRLLYIASKLKLKGFINVSTSSVTLKKQTMYSATKAAGEDICRGFVDMYGLPIVTVRPYTIIGPNEPSAHFIPTLIHSTLTGERMPYVGYPTHDYVDVRDAVTAIYTLLPHCREMKGNIVDIASGSAISNDAVRFIVEDIMGKKANINYVQSLRDYDTENWRGNPMMLESLGWKRQYSLRDSIKDMVEYESLRAN